MKRLWAKLHPGTRVSIAGAGFLGVIILLLPGGLLVGTAWLIYRKARK